MLSLRHPRWGLERPLRHRLRMAGYGFGLGLSLGLPIAMLAAGQLPALWAPDAHPRFATSFGPLAAEPSGASLSTATLQPALLRATHPVEQSDAVERAAAARQDNARIERIDTARELLARGDVIRAREILNEDGLSADPQGAFVLAETYDPNVLAGLNLAGVGAEVERAQRLYAMALIGGIEAARQRLAALR